MLALRLSVAERGRPSQRVGLAGIARLRPLVVRRYRSSEIGLSGDPRHVVDLCSAGDPERSACR